MHVALIYVPTNPVSIGVVSRIAEAFEPGLEVFAGAVLTDSRDHRTLVDVRSAIVFAWSGRTQNVVLFSALFWTFLTRYTPSKI